VLGEPPCRTSKSSASRRRPTALVASVADPKAFRSGRDFSAWIGLAPKQNSSGGKDRFGSISKRSDRYLRSLFTTGALAVILANSEPSTHDPNVWSGRALQENFVELAVGGLASMYPAFG
jgi:transposase